MNRRLNDNVEKPILIIFEGVDKSGKTTLINAFNKATNFKYVVLDRLTTSSKVYNDLFKRDNREYYESFENAIKKNFNVFVILCECNNEIIERRLIDNNEKLPKELIEISKVKESFYNEVYESFERYTIINTENDINECLRLIIRAINDMEK